MTKQLLTFPRVQQLPSGDSRGGLTFPSECRLLNITIVKERSSSLLSFVLACVVLLLQFAGSSPLLHDYLHYLGDAPDNCSQTEQPCGSLPSDESDDSCGGLCAVVLLAGGVAQTTVLQAEPVGSRNSGGILGPVTPVNLPASSRLVDTRAPPVL